MTSSTLTSAAFLDAFRRTWAKRTSTSEQALRDHYDDDTRWSWYMLNYECGFLRDVADLCQQTGLQDLEYFEGQLYTIDASFVGGIRPLDLIRRTDGGYPSKLFALIEHENKSDVETEMWKLLWWRCPLKVIIFKDWMEPERERNKDKREWLPKKLALFQDMWRSVGNFCAEYEQTEYLFIIGDRKSPDDVPHWKFATMSVASGRMVDPVFLC